MLRADLENYDGSEHEPDDAAEPDGILAQMRQWIVEDAPWWGCSLAFHFLLVCSLALVGSRMASPPDDECTVSLTAAVPEPAPQPLGDLDPAPSPPPEIEPLAPTPDTATLEPALVTTIETGTRVEDPAGAPDRFTPVSIEGDGGDGSLRGGIRLGTITGFGPGSGPGNPHNPGWYGTGGGPLGPGLGGGPFGPRHNPSMSITPPTPTSERAVTAALNWLARHQLRDGSWSLKGYTTCCRDRTCTGPGGVDADSAATALGLLPFLGAGQMHTSKCPYKTTVAAGLNWLLAHQKPDGDLRCGSTMYAHGLATIALCEAYGMTGDRVLGYAAQRAIDFIQSAQNAKTGGWRYQPGDEGDTSVVGWQVMALKSAEMANLHVDPAVFERTRAFLRSASSGSLGSLGGGMFAYQPGNPASATMTSVGLLCSQYLGAPRRDPAIVEGSAYLMQHLPDPAVRDLYYWYYATQVMHNQPGSDWDTWNRKVRRILIDSQNREGCATGSWDPQRPAVDRWGTQGGRLMMTSLAALTLEVYYRYLPLYKMEAEK